MDRTHEEFIAWLRKQHSFARYATDQLKELERLLDADPLQAARELIVEIPRQMQAWCDYAMRTFGVDLGDREAYAKFKPRTAVEAVAFIFLADNHELYKRVWIHIWLLMRNQKLRGKDFARAICKVYLETLSMKPGRTAYNLYILHKRRPDLFPKEALGEFLASYLATHISLQYPRLRAAIDEAREGNPEKSAASERFERLLQELYQEAPQVWSEKPRYTGNLMDVRTEVAWRLERRESATTDSAQAVLTEHELREKAREELQTNKLLEQAGFSKREAEMFVLDNLTGSNTEIAARMMKIKPSTARRFRKRYNDKINELCEKQRAS